MEDSADKGQSVGASTNYSQITESLTRHTHSRVRQQGIVVAGILSLGYSDGNAIVNSKRGRLCQKLQPPLFGSKKFERWGRGQIPRLVCLMVL